MIFICWPGWWVKSVALMIHGVFGSCCICLWSWLVCPWDLQIKCWWIRRCGDYNTMKFSGEVGCFWLVAMKICLIVQLFYFKPCLNCNCFRIIIVSDNLVQKCHEFWSPVTVLLEKTFDEEFKTDEVQAWFRLQDPIVNVSYYPCLFTIKLFNVCGAGKGGGCFAKRAVCLIQRG